MISKYIFGAKSIALGIYTALYHVESEREIRGFIVTSQEGNQKTLAGLPVRELRFVANELSVEERKNIQIIIATPENFFDEIKETLREFGFDNYICMDSRKESKLMEQYFSKLGTFASLHSLNQGVCSSKLKIFTAKFYRDKHLEGKFDMPKWINSLQVGNVFTPIQLAEYLDSMGKHISYKNPNYCELTGLYWIWKNQLPVVEADYYGLFHYRRILDISDDDILRLKENGVDVILPYPTIHEPDIKEHHTRYIQDSDWLAMLQALQELEPEYAEAYDEIFSQEYMYNYNILVAKREILEEYCAWLFPILERIEELSVPKGSERADRYIGYLGENLLTLYFMYHKDRLKIMHTGRIMLT